MGSIAFIPSLLRVANPPLPVAFSSPSQLRFRSCSAPQADDEAPKRQPSDTTNALGPTKLPSQQPSAPRPRNSADTTDWVASSLARRFGLGAGLAWAGFLAFGVLSEQIKTRTEIFLAEKGTRDVENAKEVILPSKVRYADLRVGGGASPSRGDLVVVDLLGKVEGDGRVFVDTFSGKRRSIAFVYGAKPYAGGMCEGVEEGLQSMRVGGKRRIVVPSELGFGSSGEDLGEGVSIPPDATLEYVVQLQKSSVAPAPS